MKKKTVNLKRLSLNKSTIVSLNGAQQAQAVGGATLAGDTSPCGPCDLTRQATCKNCPSLVTCPPGCVATGGQVTVCDLC